MKYPLKPCLIRSLLAIVILIGPVAIMAAEIAEKSKIGDLTSRIDQLYSEGKIGLGDKVFLNLQAIYSDSSLPDFARSDSPEIIKSATGYIMEAFNNWDLMSPQQQLLVSEYLTRSSFDAIYISAESNFAIYYDTIGTEAVPADDIDINGIPDYVERIGIYADSTYRHCHNTLNYLKPPGMDEKPYKIYLVRIGAYGATVADAPGDSSWNDYSSHIEIHCSFAGDIFGPNDDPEGRVIGDQKVTCAHEYLHAVQFAYDCDFGNLWWMECTAVFFEDLLFPEVNDNYNYLDVFFNDPDTFLTVPDYHAYSTFIWASYLVEKFGIGILKSTFEYFRYYEAIASIDSALNAYGERIRHIFPEFTLWNYFTANRAGEVYHADAEDYPPVEVDQVVTGFPSVIVSPVRPPDGLGSNYLICRPDPAEDGFFMFDFTGSTFVEWGLTNIIFNNGGLNVQEYLANSNGQTRWGVYDFAAIDSMVIIPCVISRYINNNNYNITVEVYEFGDVDFSKGPPNILDIVFLLNQVYKGGPVPQFDVRMSDINCDEKVNIIDIVNLINAIYKGGTFPGPCRY